MATTTETRTAIDPYDLLDVDGLLDDEERAIRDTVRQFVRERVLPEVGDWFEQGILPRELAQEFGRLGLFGMHLEGYGCAGASATAYGLTCMELEAGDSGVRGHRTGRADRNRRSPLRGADPHRADPRRRAEHSRRSDRPARRDGTRAPARRGAQ